MVGGLVNGWGGGWSYRWVDGRKDGWMAGHGDICRHGVYFLDNHNESSIVLTLSDVDLIYCTLTDNTQTGDGNNTGNRLGRLVLKECLE